MKHTTWGIISIKRVFTFYHFLLAVSHDVDVLDADELELNVGVIVFVFIAFSCSPVCKRIQLERRHFSGKSVYFKGQACYRPQSHRRCVSETFVVSASSWHGAAWEHKAHLNIQKHTVRLFFTVGWPWAGCPPHTGSHCGDWTSRWPPASARPPSSERWNPTAADCCGRWRPGRTKQGSECLLSHFRWIIRKMKNSGEKKHFILLSCILAFIRHKGKGQRLLHDSPSTHTRPWTLGS